MDNNLLRTIQALGLNDKSARIYLALLEMHIATVSDIARQSGLKRPTVYLILEELRCDGYVAELLDKKIKQYQAVDPAILLIKKKTEIKQFAEMLPLLQTIHNHGSERPRVQYIEAREAILDVYESLNYAGEAFYISSYRQIDCVFPGKFEQWLKGYARKHYRVKSHHLIPAGAEELIYGKKLKKTGQKVRVLPIRLLTDVVLTEKHLALSNLGDKPFVILIESTALVHSLRPLFEMMWQLSKEI